MYSLSLCKDTICDQAIPVRLVYRNNDVVKMCLPLSIKKITIDDSLRMSQGGNAHVKVY